MEEEKDNLIEKYILGKLSNEDRIQFELAMASEPDLEQKVHLRRIEWELEELLAEKVLRQQLGEEFEKHDHGQNIRKRNLWVVIGLAIISALVWLVYFVVNKPTATSKQNIEVDFEEIVPEIISPMAIDTSEDISTDTLIPQTKTIEYAQIDRKAQIGEMALASYTSPEGIIETRSELDENTTLALEAYKQKNYLKVIQLLKSISEDDEAELWSLRAHANFGAKKYQSANNDFNTLALGGIYKKEAEWFGLLSGMAAGTVSERSIKNKLKQMLTDQNHPYKKEAANLLKNLDKE